LSDDVNEARYSDDDPIDMHSTTTTSRTASPSHDRLPYHSLAKQNKCHQRWLAGRPPIVNGHPERVDGVGSKNGGGGGPEERVVLPLRSLSQARTSVAFSFLFSFSASENRQVEEEIVRRPSVDPARAQ
jgi:hypothetical protein